MTTTFTRPSDSLVPEVILWKVLLRTQTSTEIILTILMVDFAAHSNYVELALRELGVDAYPHTGEKTECQTNGKTLWPVVTGTFGMIDL